jgi:hypothetical protein
LQQAARRSVEPLAKNSQSALPMRGAPGRTWERCTSAHPRSGALHTKVDAAISTPWAPLALSAAAWEHDGRVDRRSRQRSARNGRTNDLRRLHRGSDARCSKWCINRSSRWRNPRSKASLPAGASFRDREHCRSSDPHSGALEKTVNALVSMPWAPSNRVLRPQGMLSGVDRPSR